MKTSAQLINLYICIVSRGNFPLKRYEHDTTLSVFFHKIWANHWHKWMSQRRSCLKMPSFAQIDIFREWYLRSYCSLKYCYLNPWIPSVNSFYNITKLSVFWAWSGTMTVCILAIILYEFLWSQKKRLYEFLRFFICD